MLFEDASTNRLEEAIRLFREIVNTEMLKNAFIILFLNRFDSFEKKVKRVPLGSVFKDFEVKKRIRFRHN